MNVLSGRLSRALRDIELARAAVIRLRTLGRPRGGANDGILILCYHGMRAGDRRRFDRQLRHLRDLADIIGLDDALAMLDGSRVKGRYVCLTFDDGYRDAFENAVPILIEQGAPAAFFVVTGWIDDNSPEIISWAECRDLAASGIEIGSHSVSHPHLSGLTEAAVAEELKTSRQRIEVELGRPCLHFACPFGQPVEDYLPERDPALTRSTGYRSFLTTIPGRAVVGADPWSLPRVRMEPGWGEAEIRYAFSR